MELLVRAGRDDHRVIAELCAPASAGLRLAGALPLSAVVADAPVAAERTQLRETVEAAGLPLLIDPLTFLLADRQAPAHPWSRLPFAIADQLAVADLADGGVQDELIDRVIAFQRQLGATVLIPPYVFMPRRDDGWLDLQLSLLRRTARYLERESVDLPVAPIFAGALRQFGPKSAWGDGVDRFLATCRQLNTKFVGLSLSWSGQGRDSLDALTALLTTTQHAASQARIVGWRQGLYGLSEVAVGAAGYETGPGHSERAAYTSLMRSRRPRPPSPYEESPHGSAFVYLAPLGRSIRRKEALALLQDSAAKAALLCTDDTCCPNGATSMTTAWRQHAVRARARQLRALSQMPGQVIWRLTKISQDSDHAAVVARTANEVLAAASIKLRVPAESFTHLARAADAIRAQAASVVA